MESECFIADILLTYSFIIFDHRTDLTDEEKLGADNARDDALGPRELRSSSKPVQSGTEWIGGTAFERSAHAVPVKKDLRVFTVGASYETPTRITAPCAHGKLDGTDENHTSIRTSLCNVSPPDMP